MDTVENLKHLGYILALHGDNISYQYRGAGDPPTEARGLLDALKEHKHDIPLLVNHFICHIFQIDQTPVIQLP